jgi:hypothetical protein
MFDGETICPEALVYTFDGETICPDVLVYTFDGETICPDALVYTFDGETNCPDPLVYTVDGETICPDPLVYTVDGETICPDVLVYTVDGEITWVDGFGIVRVTTCTLSRGIATPTGLIIAGELVETICDWVTLVGGHIGIVPGGQISLGKGITFTFGSAKLSNIAERIYRPNANPRRPTTHEGTLEYWIIKTIAAIYITVAMIIMMIAKTFPKYDPWLRVKINVANHEKMMERFSTSQTHHGTCEYIIKKMNPIITPRYAVIAKSQ